MADLTRFEQFLNHIAHPEDPIPDPLTRMEQSLLEIAENKDEAALPDYSEASDGDVLSIEDGTPAWKEPSGGGGGVIVLNEDNMRVPSAGGIESTSVSIYSDGWKEAGNVYITDLDEATLLSSVLFFAEELDGFLSQNITTQIIVNNTEAHAAPHELDTDNALYLTSASKVYALATTDAIYCLIPSTATIETGSGR